MCCTSEHQFLATFLGPKHWRGRIASGFTIEFGNAIHANSLVSRFHEKIGMCCKNWLRIFFCKMSFYRIFRIYQSIKNGKWNICTLGFSFIKYFIFNFGDRSRFLTRLSQFHQLYQRPKKRPWHIVVAGKKVLFMTLARARADCASLWGHTSASNGKEKGDH